MMSLSDATESCKGASGRLCSCRKAQVAVVLCVAASLVLCAVPLWSGQSPVSAYTSQQWTRLDSSYKCNAASSAVNRMCRFENLVLYKSQLWFIHTGEARPEIPDVLVNWHHDVHLRIQLLNMVDPTNDMKLEMATAQVTIIPQAVIVHRQWHLNYYHSLTESLFEVFNLACIHFGACRTGYRKLTPIFIDKPGVSPWAGVEGDWSAVLPNAAEALQCFFPTPAIWVDSPSVQDQVFVLQEAVAGIGLYNRKWPGAFDVATRFHSDYIPVNTTVGHYYRQGLLSCLGIRFTTPQPKQARSVTILNRNYPSGRHITNAEAVAGKVKAMAALLHLHQLPGDNEERQEALQIIVVLAEHLSLKEQVQIVSQSDIVIMNHGAAMGNIMFMAPGSVIIMYNWIKLDHVPHTWVTALIEDLGLPVNFIGLATEDRRFVSPIKENFIFQRGYAALSAEAKLDLLETGACPLTGDLQDCTDMKMNYGIDWNLLQPALTKALQIVYTDAYKNQIFTA